ncbi:tetratricopeptide repeat-containing sensor histidine kinase [Polluticaenibacter yanchengensis]|uniref:Sensor histidine kinase n=1 Tax=Polluticaenibacter yanchengensis TaxID=3014562 RepID=A0ABT4UKC3_9BACT|nr:sensor histidine kinase [Chitinophagaceae bacterium LY-5]
MKQILLLITTLILSFVSMSQTGKDYLELGIAEYKKGNYDIASKYLDSCITEAKKTHNEANELKALNNLGNIESDKGNNLKAVEYYQKALKVADKLNDQKYIAHINKNIGALYASLKRFDESLKYYYVAEKAAVNFNDSLLIADCHNNIGIIYEQQQKFDEAITRYDKALEIYEKLRSNDGLAMTFSNLAIVYKLKKNYEKAIEFNKKSLALSQANGDKWAEAATLNNIGNLYGILGKNDLYNEFSLKSLAIAKEIKANEIIYTVYENLADVNFKLSNYAKAYEYQKLFAAAKDSFNNIEVNKQFSELNIKYETEKKEKALAETKLKLTKEEVDSKQKNLWLIILIGLVLILLIVFRSFRIKSRLKQEKLNLQNKLLEEQTLAKIQQQRLEISSELHDSLGAQLTFVNNVLDGIKVKPEKLDEDTSKKIDILSDLSGNAVLELRNTIWALNTDDILLSGLKNKMLNFRKNAAEANENIQFQFNFDITHDVKLNTKQAINIFRLFQEVLNNAIKHAHASNINTAITQKDDQLEIIIEDDGVGFDWDKNKTQSYGLSNIQQRVALINGSLKVKTGPGKGTHYNIIINL